jgi:stage II sporulation protein D
VRTLVAGLLALLLVPPAAARVFLIQGRGWGHGVGMSQWGAEGFALHGWDCRRILAHYYPGTQLAGTRNVTVRVLLEEGRSRLTIGSRRAFRVIAEGRSRRLGAGRYALPSHRLRPPLRFEPGAQPLLLDGVPYRGAIVVTGSPGALSAVNHVHIERYLRGVVPSEMPYYWRPAALQAQAVAARSYALSQLDPLKSFDLYRDTRDQVYGGVRAERPPANLAVGATAGRLLTWGGRPALTYYFSSSGGQTAAAADGISGAAPLPYLISVADPYDGISPHHRWGPLRFSSRDLARRLGVPGVRSLALVLDGSKRVSSVLVRWRGSAVRVSGATFAGDLGLRSNWFRVVGAEAVSRGSAPGPSVPRPVGEWPAGRSGYTVVLDSVPAPAGLRAARSAAARARRAGLPAVGILVSSEFASLRPGFYVVFSGVYRTAAQADAAARLARSRYPAAYPRRIAP